MATMVFTNFPVKMYRLRLNFTAEIRIQENEDFLQRTNGLMVWDETFWIMLLEYDLQPIPKE